MYEFPTPFRPAGSWLKRLVRGTRQLLGGSRDSRPAAPPSAAQVAREIRVRGELDSAADDLWARMETQAEKIKTGELPSSLTLVERNRFAYLVGEMRKLTWEAYEIYAPYCPMGQAAMLTPEVLNQIPEAELGRLSTLLEREGLLRKEFGELTDRARSRGVPGH